MIVEHIGLNVSDMERSLNFYMNVLGFKILRQSDKKAYLYSGDDMLELKESPVPADFKRPTTKEDWRAWMYNPVGIGHIGIRVDDMEETVKRISEHGGDVVIPPYKFEPEARCENVPNSDKLRRAANPIGKPYWKIAVVADPDGIMFELLER